MAAVSGRVGDGWPSNHDCHSRPPANTAVATAATATNMARIVNGFATSSGAPRFDTAELGSERLDVSLPLRGRRGFAKRKSPSRRILGQLPGGGYPDRDGAGGRRAAEVEKRKAAAGGTATAFVRIALGAERKNPGRSRWIQVNAKLVGHRLPDDGFLSGFIGVFKVSLPGVVFLQVDRHLADLAGELERDLVGFGDRRALVGADVGAFVRRERCRIAFVRSGR